MLMPGYTNMQGQPFLCAKSWLMHAHNHSITERQYFEAE